MQLEVHRKKHIVVQNLRKPTLEIHHKKHYKILKLSKNWKFLLLVCQRCLMQSSQPYFSKVHFFFSSPTGNYKSLDMLPSVLVMHIILYWVDAKMTYLEIYLKRFITEGQITVTNCGNLSHLAKV